MNEILAFLLHDHPSQLLEELYPVSRYVWSLWMFDKAAMYCKKNLIILK